MKNMDLRVEVLPDYNYAGKPQPQTIRVLVIYHKAWSGRSSPMTSAELLATGYTSSPMDSQYRDQILTLADESISMGGYVYQTTGGGVWDPIAPMSVTRQIFRKFHLPAEFYDSSTGAPLDVQRGMVYVLCFSSVANSQDAYNVFISGKIKYINS